MFFVEREEKNSTTFKKKKKKKKKKEENVVVVVNKDDRVDTPPDAAHGCCRVPGRFCRTRDRDVLFAVGDWESDDARCGGGYRSCRRR